MPYAWTSRSAIDINVHTHAWTGVRDLWADLLGANIHVQKPLTGQFWKYMLVLWVKICLY